MDADAIGLPSAERVALFRVLDLDHLGAEIGELQADHVARDEPRHVDDPHAIERTRGPRLEGLFDDAHRPDPATPFPWAEGLRCGAPGWVLRQCWRDRFQASAGR